jgi:RNA polymerase sigma-70 factor, ECF subfamily
MNFRDVRLDERPEEELLRRFAESGDSKYFSELYRRHSRKVFLSCYAFFRDAAAAEDCAQETFLRVFEQADRFQDGDFVGWLMRVARNICIDHWRKKRPTTSLDGEEQEMQIAAWEPGTGGGMHLALMQLRIELKALPSHQQECLAMKIEGYSYEETAAATGLAVEAVRSHLQNARRTLRLRMQGTLAEIA